MKRGDDKALQRDYEFIYGTFMFETYKKKKKLTNKIVHASRRIRLTLFLCICVIRQPFKLFPNT